MDIHKVTAEEKLEAIRNIINRCDWLKVLDSEGTLTSDVSVTIDCEEWDNLKSLLRDDAS